LKATQTTYGTVAIEKLLFK